MELDKIKAKRNAGNKNQVRAYHQMLEFIDKRQIPNFNKDKMPRKTLTHEKEREFCDCIRIILQNGYELKQSDILDILKFIRIQELLYFDEQ